MIEYDSIFLPILAKIVDNFKEINFIDRIKFSKYVGEESAILNNLQLHKFQN